MEMSYDTYRRNMEEIQFKKDKIVQIDAEKKKAHAEYRKYHKIYRKKVKEYEEGVNELIGLIPKRI